MVDFHTHILPGIDDGSDSADTSLKMLERLYSQGVDRVILTPHFYMQICDVETFLSERVRAFNALSDAAMGKDSIPHIALGAEVLMFPETGGIDDLESLCIEGTNYMLLEMPFSEWSNSTYESVERIMNRGIIPIIAHFERYKRYHRTYEYLYRLRDMGCVIQSNAEFFRSFIGGRRAIKFVREEMIDLLGSDCHNLTSRGPEIADAFCLIEKKLGEFGNENIDYMTNQVLKDAVFRI